MFGNWLTEVKMGPKKGKNKSRKARGCYKKNSEEKVVQSGSRDELESEKQLSNGGPVVQSGAGDVLLDSDKQLTNGCSVVQAGTGNKLRDYEKQLSNEGSVVQSGSGDVLLDSEKQLSCGDSVLQYISEDAQMMTETAKGQFPYV